MAGAKDDIVPRICTWKGGSYLWPLWKQACYRTCTLFWRFVIFYLQLTIWLNYCESMNFQKHTKAIWKGIVNFSLVLDQQNVFIVHQCPKQQQSPKWIFFIKKIMIKVTMSLALVSFKRVQFMSEELLFYPKGTRKTFNLIFKSWTSTDGAFIFYMYIPWEHTFTLFPNFWPWPWKGKFTIGVHVCLQKLLYMKFL